MKTRNEDKTWGQEMRTRQTWTTNVDSSKKALNGKYEKKLVWEHVKMKFHQEAQSIGTAIHFPSLQAMKKSLQRVKNMDMSSLLAQLSGQFLIMDGIHCVGVDGQKLLLFISAWIPCYVVRFTLLKRCEESSEARHAPDCTDADGFVDLTSLERRAASQRFNRDVNLIRTGYLSFRQDGWANSGIVF